MAWRSL